MKEADLKRAVTDYLQILENQGKLMFLRLNAGSFILSNPDGSFRRRVQGVKKGTADFVLMINHHYKLPRNDEKIGWFVSCRVIFLELKGEKGKQTSEQREFETQAGMQGAEYHIIRDVDELAEILR